MKQSKERRWRIATGDTAEEERLVREIGVYPVVAKLLVNRGLGSVKDAAAFLRGTMDELPDPFGLKGMEKAVATIEKAITNKVPIVVYGDYDVDGITATSLLYRFLKRCEADVTYYIPERQSEGYGLNEEALEHIIERGDGLVVSVD